MNIKEIKGEAKSYLKGNWGTAIGSLFIMLFVTWAIQSAMSLIAGTTSLLQGISTQTMESADLGLAYLPMFLGNMFIMFFSIFFVNFVQQLIRVGYKWAMLDLVDGKAYSVGSMFQVFNREILKTIGLVIMINILTSLWTLLFIVPGIIKKYSYSQAYNILKDNPEVGIMDAITISRKLMDGKKGNLFILQLTFALWYLIPGIVLFGLFIFSMVSSGSNDFFAVVLLWLIGLIFYGIYAFGMSLYLTPYTQASEQVFYRQLTDSLIH